MCYFVSVGATAPTHLLSQLFDEQAELDVAAVPASPLVVGAFPAEDHVCCVTSRGCSCDFVVSHPRTSSAQTRRLAAGFRRSVAKVARQFGSVRLLVHRQPQPRLRPAPAARTTLTVQEFLHREHWFIEDVLVEVSDSEPLALGGFS